MKRGSTFAALLGTVLEAYDYSLLILFLPILAPLFSPVTDPFVALMMGNCILFLSLTTRPLGGLFFGYIGDKYGRKRALTLSIMLMAIPSFLTGVLPTYATIGALAPILLVVFKATQSLSYGGEYSGAGLFVVEHAKRGEKGRQGSLLTISTLVGWFLASIVGLIFTHRLIPDWCWRIPFILGGGIGFLGFFFRRSLKESPEFIINREKHQEFKKLNMKRFFKNNKGRILCSIGIGGMATAPFTVVCIYMLPVLKVKNVISTSEMMIMNALYMIFSMAVLYLGGWLSDKISQEKLMKWGASGLFVVAIPGIYAFNSQDLFYIVIVHLALLASNEIFLGPSNAFLCRLFPVNYRYRGISFGFCLGMVLFGGLTPYVCVNITEFIGFKQLPAFWIMTVAFFAYLSIWYGEILIKRSEADKQTQGYYVRAA